MERALQLPGKTSIKDQNFIFSTMTLARWRLRQTWFLLLMVGVGMVAVVTIASAIPLFSSVATVANLHNLLNASPTTGELNLSMTTQGLSTNVISHAQQTIDPLMQRSVAPYLSQSRQLSIQTTGLHIMNPASLRGAAPLNIYATLIEQVKPYLHLIQGAWPQVNSSSGEIEALVTPEEAQSLHIAVGSLLTLQGDFYTRPQDMTGSMNPNPAGTAMSVRIVGIFEVTGQGSAYLHGETFQPTLNNGQATSTLLLPAVALLAKFDKIAQSAHIDAVFSPLTFQLNWYYHLQTSSIQLTQLDDLTARLTSFQAGITRNFKNIQQTTQGTYLSPYIVQAALSNPTPGSYELPDLLNQYSSKLALVNLASGILALLIMALIIFFIGLTVILLVERQIETIALLSSRGASAPQIFWSLLFQGFLLSVLALALGPLLAAGIVVALATHALSGGGQDALNLVMSQPGQLFLTTGGYALGAILVALLTMVLLLRRAATLDVLALRRETARASHRPAWIRYYFDVAAAVIALTGYFISLYLAGQARLLDLRTQSLILTPLALVAPIFLLISGFLLFLRFSPLLLRLGSWLGRRRKGATTMLALVQMSRTPRQTLRTTMLLGLATAFAIFSLVFAASQGQRAADIAAYETGADFSGGLPASLIQTASAAGSPTEEVTARYQHIPGVLSATAGYVGQGTVSNTPIEVRAVDTQTFARTANWDTRDSSQSLPSLMNLLIQQRVTQSYGAGLPAIIDESTQALLHVNTGDAFTVDMSNLSPISFTLRVIAIISHIPTVNSSTTTNSIATSDYTVPGGVLVDYDSYNTVYQAEVRSAANVLAPTNKLKFIPNLPLNHIWLRTKDDVASLASVRAALNSPALFLNNLYDRRELDADLQADPLYLNLLVILAIGLVTTLLLALMGDLLASWLSVRTRLTNFAVLRALGATPGQIAGVLLWEQGVAYIMALLLGVASGFLLVLTTVPALTFIGVPARGALSQLSDAEFYVVQHAIPAQITIPGSLILILIMLVVTCLGALALMVRTALRPSMSQELRLNAD